MSSTQLGVSRPPLDVADLPEPEEVFKVRKLGPRQVVQFVIGPSLIALGISIGSGTLSSHLVSAVSIHSSMTSSDETLICSASRPARAADSL